MLKKNNSNSKNKQKPIIFGSTLSTIISIISLFGFGFGTGSYITNILHKIEIHEINQQYRIQLYNQRVDFDDKITAFALIFNNCYQINYIAVL